MDLLHMDQQEPTNEARRRVAEEIYTEISVAVQRLLQDEKLEETHSRVVELRDEQEIVRRSLGNLAATELTARAA